MISIFFIPYVLPSWFYLYLSIILPFSQSFRLSFSAREYHKIPDPGHHKIKFMYLYKSQYYDKYLLICDIINMKIIRREAPLWN